MPAMAAMTLLDSAAANRIYSVLKGSGPNYAWAYRTSNGFNDWKTLEQSLVVPADATKGVVRASLKFANPELDDFNAVLSIARANIDLYFPVKGSQAERLNLLAAIKSYFAHANATAMFTDLEGMF